jgi:pilus assembly protein TadC
MTGPAVSLGAVGVFLIVVALMRMWWDPVVNGVRAYLKAREHLDDLSAAIVGAAGGFDDEDEEWDYLRGISGEAHDFLGLSKRRYEKGVINLSILTGIFGAFFFMILGAGLVTGLILGILFIGMAYGIIIFTENDKLRTRKGEQVRQFPFFLDIFLLMVQSNGNIEDAINTYREIFGQNAIAQELTILQEDLKSHSLLDSFDRLRNRVGDEDLRNILGELTQKLKTGTDLQTTLEQQAEDMRNLREELGAQAAERLNAKFNIPVVFAALATLMIFLAPAISQMKESGFL